MVRRALLWLALLTLLCAGSVFAADPCRFIVMGDNRPAWDDQDVITPAPMYVRAAQGANLLRPDFVVIIGDLIHGYTDTAEMEKQWRAFETATKRFKMPVYLVVGNHDVFSKESERLYQQHAGKLWYSFDVKGSHFIVLDSEDQTAPLRIAGTQLAWLKSDLAQAKGKHIFVFLHNPIWRENGDWKRDVQPLLARAGVDTVFAGHWHNYELEPSRGGVRYIITGGAGAELEPGGTIQGAFYHYVFATVLDHDKASLAVLHTDGVDPENVVTTEQRRLADQFVDEFHVPGVAAEATPVTQTISIPLRNPFPEPITGHVEFALTPGWSAVPRTAPFTVPGRGAGALTFTLTADPQQIATALPYHIAYEVSGRGVGEEDRDVLLKRIVPCPTARVTLDGALDEWAGAAPIVLNRRSQIRSDDPARWGGPDKLSVQAWTAQDTDNLYVAVRVKDATFQPVTPDGAVDSSDAVLVYVDGRGPRDFGESHYSPGAGFMILAPGTAGQPVRIFSPREKARTLAGVRAASQVTADGYTMEIAIPLRDFPAHGDLLGFDLGVNDFLSPGKYVALVWNGTGADWKDPSPFGMLRLR